MYNKKNSVFCALWIPVFLFFPVSVLAKTNAFDVAEDVLMEKWAMLPSKDFNVEDFKLMPPCLSLYGFLGSGDLYSGVMPGFIQDHKKEQGKNLADLRDKDEPKRKIKADDGKNLDKKSIEKIIEKEMHHPEKGLRGSLLERYRELKEHKCDVGDENQFAKDHRDDLNRKLVKPDDDKELQEFMQGKNELNLDGRADVKGMVVECKGYTVIESVEQLQHIVDQGEGNLCLKVVIGDSEECIKLMADLIVQLLRVDSIKKLQIVQVPDAYIDGVVVSLFIKAMQEGMSKIDVIDFSAISLEVLDFCGDENEYSLFMSSDKFKQLADIMKHFPGLQTLRIPNQRQSGVKYYVKDGVSVFLHVLADFCSNLKILYIGEGNLHSIKVLAKVLPRFKSLDTLIIKDGLCRDDSIRLLASINLCPNFRSLEIFVVLITFDQMWGLMVFLEDMPLQNLTLLFDELGLQKTIYLAQALESLLSLESLSIEVVYSNIFGPPNFDRERSEILEGAISELPSLVERKFPLDDDV